MKRKASAELNNGVPMTSVAESNLANADNYHNLPVSAAAPGTGPSSYQTLELSNGDDASVVGAPLYQSVPRDGGFASNSDASNYQNVPVENPVLVSGYAAPEPQTGGYSASSQGSYQNLPQTDTYSPLDTNSYRPLDTIQSDNSYRPLGEF